jgi:hypothetical protein
VLFNHQVEFLQLFKKLPALRACLKMLRHYLSFFVLEFPVVVSGDSILEI